MHVCRGRRLPAEKSQRRLFGGDQTLTTSNQKVPIIRNGHLRVSYLERVVNLVPARFEISKRFDGDATTNIG